MSVEITCGKCGEKIKDMKMLKSLKDVLNPTSGKCPSCGQVLNLKKNEKAKARFCGFIQKGRAP